MKYVLMIGAALALGGCDELRAINDTPQEHQQRLVCEMNRMSGDYYGGHGGMSAENAEAYCEKEMEAQWLMRQKGGSS
jgi:hypothetical protein